MRYQEMEKNLKNANESFASSLNQAKEEKGILIKSIFEYNTSSFIYECSCEGLKYPSDKELKKIFDKVVNMYEEQLSKYTEPTIDDKVISGLETTIANLKDNINEYTITNAKKIINDCLYKNYIEQLETQMAKRRYILTEFMNDYSNLIKKHIILPEKKKNLQNELEAL